LSTVGPFGSFSSASITPALMASSSVRYSLTETFSLAARRVKKKLISMVVRPVGAPAGVRERAKARA
jgi:hypothetical protein